MMDERVFLVETKKERGRERELFASRPSLRSVARGSLSPLFLFFFGQLEA